MKMIIASHNDGKVKEFQSMLKPFSIHLIKQSELGIEDVAETASTFIENALIKARHAAAFSGMPAIADDSGLVVAALKGAPGIYSARYAGIDASSSNNIEKLLKELTSVPADKRQAYFYCALVFISHPEDPSPLISTGKWAGCIATAPQGTEGFGYDPVFYVEEEKKSAAELSPAIKNRISHRGKALQSLMTHFQEKWYECTFR